MKKIITLSFLIIIATVFSIQYTNVSAETKKPIKVKVTEEIPGLKCSENLNKGKDSKGRDKQPLYECEVTRGFGTVITMMGKMLKYFVFIASLGGVLFIVINGILYSMGGAEQSLKDESKKRIVQTLIGLVLLFLSSIILNLIAPWVWTL